MDTLKSIFGRQTARQHIFKGISRTLTTIFLRTSRLSSKLESVEFTDKTPETYLKEVLMSKQQLKLLATTLAEKPRQQKPVIQAEGKLTEAQLEAIAGGAPETSPTK